MVKFENLGLSSEYNHFSSIINVINEAIASNSYDMIEYLGFSDYMKSKFLIKFLISVYNAYPQEIKSIIELQSFDGKVLLKRHTFPFLWLNDRSKKNVISAVEEKYLDHIRSHMKSTKDSLIDFIDSPPEKRKYKKNFMKALKLTGEENLRIVFKEIRGKYGVIVGINDKTTDNAIKSNVPKLESLYELCEKAAEVDLNSLESIDGWLGFAVVEGYNKPPYFEEFKFHENDLLECLDSE